MLKVKLANIIVVSICILISGCGKPMDKSRLLKDSDSVYVPIDPMTLVSLQMALLDKGYGNVKSSDMQIVFVTGETVFDDGMGPGAVIYSDLDFIPQGQSFIRMRVWQLYEAVLADTSLKGINVDPGISSNISFTVSAEEMKKSLDKLPRLDKLPLDISVKK